MSLETEQWEKHPQCKCKINVLGGKSCHRKNPGNLAVRTAQIVRGKEIFLGKAEREFEKSTQPWWAWNWLGWCSLSCIFTKWKSWWTSPSLQTYCSGSHLLLFRIKQHGETLCPECLILFNECWKETSITNWACRILGPSAKQPIHSSKISYAFCQPSFWTIIAHYCLTRWDAM